MLWQKWDRTQTKKLSSCCRWVAVVWWDCQRVPQKLGLCHPVSIEWNQKNAHEAWEAVMVYNVQIRLGIRGYNMYAFMRCGFWMIFRGRLCFAKTFKRYQSTIQVVRIHPYIMILNIWISTLVCTRKHYLSLNLLASNDYNMHTVITRVCVCFTVWFATEWEREPERVVSDILLFRANDEMKIQTASFCFATFSLSLSHTHSFTCTTDTHIAQKIFKYRSMESFLGVFSG